MVVCTYLLISIIDILINIDVGYSNKVAMEVCCIELSESFLWAETFNMGDRPHPAFKHLQGRLSEGKSNSVAVVCRDLTVFLTFPE